MSYRNKYWSNPQGSSLNSNDGQSPLKRMRPNTSHQHRNQDDRYNSYDSRGRDAPQSSPASSRVRQPFVEPAHSGPAWNWESYFSDIHKWQDKHKLSYYKSRCMALEFENQMLFEQVRSLIEENSVLAAERGHVPTILLPNFPGGLTGFVNESPTAEQLSKAEETSPEEQRNTSDESLVCDVPETMVAAIEKSIRHKLNLHKERKAEAAKQNNGEVDKEKEKKIVGPTEPRGFKRKEEMKKLYGESAELIQNLETSVQHNFNRDRDAHNPPMWMTEPLNMMTNM